MKTYYHKSTQFLPIRLPQAWEFFSSPNNLALITPKRLNFEIISKTGGDKMFEGQVILYKITVLPFVRMVWETEIAEVRELQHFTDIQRQGPYASWVHKHIFKEVKGGVEIIDELSYSIPFGLVGQLAHFLFVGREVKSIFNYRFRVLQEYFKTKN